jgi:ferredoxin
MTRLTVDPLVCEAFGRCVATAPAIFELDDDEVLHIRSPHPAGTELDRARVAVRLCPKLALTLTETAG